MKRILASLLIASALMAAPASAKVAVWEKTDQWIINGDTDVTMCSAITTYNSGYKIGIFFSGRGADLSIGGVAATIGQTYFATVRVSTGQEGVMQAVGIADDVVVFRNIDATTIKALANARAIYIQGLGTFNLVGSKRAMISAWACYKALSSF